ncbi:MAG TPA: ATP phosphoribosyltransferase [bacterium]|nr:ATP phosphoribosyltransferase [bacterium]
MTVAVASGRLLEDSMRTLEAAGYLTAETWRTTRRLILPCLDPHVRCLIAKPADLLTYVEHGAADLGIVGKDMLLEQGRDVYELVDLGFGACRGIVAFPEEKAAGWEALSPIRIATKYPRVTERYFWGQGRSVEVVEMNGTVELAPQVGVADGILDLVMTGRTLVENHLLEVTEVFRSSARLVVNRVSLRTRAEAVRTVVERMREAASARARSSV